jgi:5'-nucleotidase
MKHKLSFLSAALLLQSLVFSYSASALNIVLTNDDSWETNNIKEMKKALEAEGHDVIMSAPCLGQSGKGGAVNLFQTVNVDETKAEENEYCVGDIDETKAFENFTEGTPIMAVLYGIDIAAQAKWGKAPDLVVSGPNEGNNLGYMNNNSGTLGATMIALTRGIPAIAVSASENSAIHSEEAAKVAAVVVDIIEKLEVNRAEGDPLLPPYMGLNVNTPDDLDNHLGYKFTDVGWNGGGVELRFYENLGSNQTVIDYMVSILMEQGMSKAEAKTMLDGKNGVGMVAGDAGDSDPQSEGVAVQEGYITISTIDGNVQAARAKVALTEQLLNGLGQ